MSQRLFLPALLLMSICTFSISAEISAEQVALDLMVCNEELSKIRLNFEYLSFLTYMFDSVKCQYQRDSAKVDLNNKEEIFLGELVNLNEQGIVLENLINKQDSTRCTPCFQFSVGSFCKDILILGKSVSQSLISVQIKMAEEAVLFSEFFIEYLKKKIENGSTSGLLPQKKANKLQQDVRTAQRLVSTNRHKVALQLILDAIRELNNNN